MIERIDYISDFHLDFLFERGESLDGRDATKKFLKVISGLNKQSDYIIIAGDVSHSNNLVVTFLDLLIKEGYKKVFYVSGNHEYYLVLPEEISKFKNNSIEKVKDLYYRLSKIKGLEVLDGNVVTLDSGVTIGGSSGWYDGTYAEKRFYMTKQQVIKCWYQTMNDSKYILPSSEVLETYFNKEYHKLKYVISKKPDVVVSHVAPLVSPEIPVGYAMEPSTGFFCFDGKVLINRCVYHQTQYWVFGHNHYSVDYEYGLRFVCNPYGYHYENKGLKKCKQIEVAKIS
jgi:predicted phosphohydrolase